MDQEKTIKIRKGLNDEKILSNKSRVEHNKTIIRGFDDERFCSDRF